MFRKKTSGSKRGDADNRAIHPFNSVESARKTTSGIQLVGPNLKYDLEHQVCFIMFESTELTIRSSVDWGEIGETGKYDKPISRTRINAKLKSTDANLFVFEGEEFLGEVSKISFECSASDEEYLSVGYSDGSEYHPMEPTFLISACLSDDHFKEIFHPIWIRQSKSVLDLAINVPGFQSSSERLFSSRRNYNFVFDANSHSASFSSICLRTDITP